MGVYRQFPYSNFHEMNMDEIIKIVKNMLEEWAQYYAEWEAWMAEINADWSNYQNVMNAAWASMQNFINNYFDNLDVQEEINNKIISMVHSGEFGAIVAPYIPPQVTAWLNTHITEPEGVVIDTSLSVSGACADAKATGDAIYDADFRITDIENDLHTVKNSYNLTSYYALVSDLKNGATISGNTITIPSGSSGMSTYLGVRTFNMANMKGKRLFFDIEYSFSGEDITAHYRPEVYSIDNGVTVEYIKFENNHIKAVVSVDENATSTFVVVALLNGYTHELVNSTSITLGTYTVLSYDDLDVSIQDMIDDTIYNNESIAAVSDHKKYYYNQARGPYSIVRGADGNAIYDADTRTYTIPANVNCGGISLGYRYVAQNEDLNKTIRFIVNFDADLYDDNYIRPLVYWNYVDVTNESYVSTSQTEDAMIFDITIPNERKNLDLRILYGYYGSVNQIQTITLESLESYFLPLTDPIYVFDSNHFGETLTPFGDSYTAQGKWQPFVKSRLGLSGYSGWSQTGGTLTSVYTEIENIDTDADIVTVWIGTNDYGNNRKVGNLLDDVTDESIKDPWGYTTFCAALNYVCNWLSNNMKGKCIVFITPTQRYDSVVETFVSTNGVNSKNEALNNAGFALEDYANAMIEVANYWGYPVCDLYHESGINKNSYTAFYQSDALHPSEDGAALLAMKISMFINQQI